ncbi:MAG: hypothetical protein HRT58_14760 [Crocinitomicaceae bacterium]|nr:hypothetical protein [Flavobacteriales bacterium]NQZ36929.1 hypothetical protein [Crocinitomicaceae bacterium]
MNDFEFTRLMTGEKTKIHVSSFKKHYSPIDLAGRLRYFVDKGIIKIKWKRGLIYVKGKVSFEEVYKEKIRITKKQPVIPGYMQDEKIEINKPFIPNKEGGAKS